MILTYFHWLITYCLFLTVIYNLVFRFGEDNMLQRWLFDYWFNCYIVIIINVIWFTGISCFYYLSAISCPNLAKTSYRSHWLSWVPLLIGRLGSILTKQKSVGCESTLMKLASSKWPKYPYKRHLFLQTSLGSKFNVNFIIRSGCIIKF